MNGMTNLEVAPPTAGRFIEEGRDHEIHFIIDSSKSITEKEYEISIRFAKNLVERVSVYYTICFNAFNKKRFFFLIKSMITNGNNN